MNEVKVIKRYQNRKLYDTHQSCYVTLEEISQMIKNGDDLRVIDNKTKNDITQATLTQLLYETERKTANPVLGFHSRQYEGRCKPFRKRRLFEPYRDERTRGSDYAVIRWPGDLHSRALTPSDFLVLS